MDPPHERLPIRTVWFLLLPAWLHRGTCPTTGTSPRTISGTLRLSANCPATRPYPLVMWAPARYISFNSRKETQPPFWDTLTVCRTIATPRTTRQVRRLLQTSVRQLPASPPNQILRTESSTRIPPLRILGTTLCR